jgi:uncharacterized membrane protein YqaE (UPF0057 family)
MRYLIAILLPPLAVLLCGKPLQAILNLVLTCFFWIPGVVHALFIVNETIADRRQGRLIKEMRRNRRVLQTVAWQR